MDPLCRAEPVRKSQQLTAQEWVVAGEGYKPDKYLVVRRYSHIAWDGSNQGIGPTRKNGILSITTRAGLEIWAGKPCILQRRFVSFRNSFPRGRPVA
ncbi:hypothetical protein DSO57_1035489 [Entomophthora muscae]|uniref:Uncharacterized protein n=1 Tax=Entomophthora muscae TaxID=34485 RepID=A0ACC2TXE7_9FUNG|nr:hypothetical protein DSO57_1035489 [Entomophthora muscae]